jgi:hypothetical protein
MYNVSDLEGILPYSFDSRNVICKSSFEDPDENPACEKMGFFMDGKNSIEISYEEKKSGDEGIHPAEILIAKEYLLYERGDEKKAFRTVDRLLREKNIKTMLYEKEPIDDRKMNELLDYAYSSLDDKSDKKDNVYVYMPDNFYIHKIKESTVLKLDDGYPVELRLEINTKNTEAELSDIERILSILD